MLKMQRIAGERGARRRDASVILIALAAVALEFSVSARYGYHRDELYFLAAGHHLALGYVDQPLLAPLVARVESIVFANSLVGMRVVPALLLGVMVLMAASMARLLGGGPVASRLAALATALCSEYVGTAHLLTTTIFDFAAWAGVLWCCCHVLSGDSPRWLLLAGLFAGIGLEAKWNLGFLAAGLFMGLLVTGAARPVVANRWAIGGLALAAMLAWPDVVWQAMHGWPNFSVFRSLNQSAGHNRAVYVPAQVIYTGLAATPLWIAGIVSLWRRDTPDRRWRALAVAMVSVLVAQLVLGGKPYYVGGIFTLAFASGAVALERRIAAQRARGRRVVLRPGGVAAAIVVTGAIALPIALPILPARALHSVALQKINYDLAETIAWPREVAVVAAVYRALPIGQRRHAIVLSGNYGEAAAIDRYGEQFGLAGLTSYSGANSFWLWGPPPADATTVVADNIDPRLLHRLFRTVQLRRIYENGIGVANDEQGTEVFVASGLRVPWVRSWRWLQNYS